MYNEIERKNIYYVYKHTYLSFSLGFLRSHYVRKSVANCERKDGSKDVLTTAKPSNLRICERNANARCERRPLQSHLSAQSENELFSSILH